MGNLQYSERTFSSVDEIFGLFDHLLKPRSNMKTCSVIVDGERINISNIGPDKELPSNLMSMAGEKGSKVIITHRQVRGEGYETHFIQVELENRKGPLPYLTLLHEYTLRSS